uniref:Chaperone protein DnaJ 1 n=2 Tax=Anthurium amnicola TaxID=1678845 RepID=A0A1D1XFP3_9ARAE
MEFATFSSGTERAVKTWQATQGTIENGIMTSELLDKLFMELELGKVAVNKSGDPKGDFISGTKKDGANGAAVTSMTGFTEIQQTVIKDDGVTEVEVSEQRVFLLGENRWEEPSRLVGRDNLIGNKAVSGTKCLSCRGQGRLMCTECDGSGEPNIEPQFLEWVDEGAKCPYCEGLGYTICDVCDGKTTV